MLDSLPSEFASNSIQTWALAASVSTFVAILLYLIRAMARKYFQRLSRIHDPLAWDILLDITKRTKWPIILILALFIGAQSLELSEAWDHKIRSTLIIFLLLQLGYWTSGTLKLWIEAYRAEQLKKDPGSATTLNIINFIGKLVLWVVVLLLILDNLGVNITALVAGLGVGGIAVALAVQTILSDLFASLSIVLDKPFVIGDFLIIDDLLGSVEFVGMKTTRLRSLSGEQLIFSNSDLLNSRIRNYGRMYERRVVFSIGVTYQTSRTQLQSIPNIIRNAVEAQAHTRFDRSHFKEYGNFSLNFETVYYIQSADYNTYMDIQQAINFALHATFEEQGIEFAYPTQTLFVQNSSIP